jgi:hypothetical protein
LLIHPSLFTESLKTNLYIFLIKEQQKKQEAASSLLSETLDEILCGCCSAVMLLFSVRFKRSQIEKPINRVGTITAQYFDPNFWSPTRRFSQLPPFDV